VYLLGVDHVEGLRCSVGGEPEFTHLVDHQLRSLSRRHLWREDLPQLALYPHPPWSLDRTQHLFEPHLVDSLRRMAPKVFCDLVEERPDLRLEIRRISRPRPFVEHVL